MKESRYKNGEDSLPKIFFQNLHKKLDKPKWSSEIANSVYFDEMRKWKINIDHYVSGDKECDSFETYHSQPLEASAKKYASSETEALIHFIAVYGNK